MKVFTLLASASLAVAQSDLPSRRRLALAQCQFAQKTSGGAFNPTCQAQWSWTGLDSKGEPAGLSLTKGSINCCTNQLPGYDDANKAVNQQACANTAFGNVFSSSECADIKNEHDACQAVDPTKAAFFTVGYEHSDNNFNGYVDIARSGLSCDTVGGYSGTPDLQCSAATGGFFALRGCSRGDLTTIGTDLTSTAFLVVPNAAPSDTGNPHSSFAACKNSAVKFQVNAFSAGNGACDHNSLCSDPHHCEVYPQNSGFNGNLVPSESEDTYVSPLYYVSKISETCVEDNSGADKAKDCPEAASNTNTGKYGGFKAYGDRLSCWRNIGGTYAINKKNTDMKGLDLTYEVLHAASNVGIATTTIEYDGFATDGIWRGDNNEFGVGYAVCDGVRTTGVGCTAELGALMCEAYNTELVRTGKTLDEFTRCEGFVLADSPQYCGNIKCKSKPGYQPQDGTTGLVVGFYSTSKKSEAGFNRGKNTDKGGGNFQYVKVANCKYTDSTNCARCVECENGKVLENGLCKDACTVPGQYNNNGVCTYCNPFCIACSTDGTSCNQCHADFSLSSDKTSCEETGCAVPAKLLDGNNKELLAGDDNHPNGPACSAGGNIVPSQVCFVKCTDGHFGDSGKNFYECKKKGDAPVGPTVKCTACTVENCKTCPGDTCTVCIDGYVFNKATNKCDPQACPNSDEASKAGECTLCGDGFHGALTWDSSKLAYDSSACTACPANCEKCEDKATECKKCDSAYDLNTVTKVCVLNPGCDRGFVGRPTFDSSSGNHDKSEGKGCTISKEPCEDASEEAGKCTDCADGYVGSLGWDFVKATDTSAGAADVKEEDSPWNRQNCKKVTCPVSSESECKTCPEFTDGVPEWDDLFNTWEGCISNDFGFSGPSASWSGSVSADKHTIDVKSAEMLHIANGQYDVSKSKWVCDEGYAGVGCKQRLCPETTAFVSGTDSFTPSLSGGNSITTDIGHITSSTFTNQHSYRECSGRGTCDFETGLCECFVGFTGVGCQRTTCPNGCSGHGVCVNDDVSNYHAAGGGNVPSNDINVEVWGNMWASEKFQGCRCDGGWGGADCSLRQCPRGDDPETACNEDLGNDVQIVRCTIPVDKEVYFKLRFTTQLGHRFNTRAIVIKKIPTNDEAGEAPFLVSSEDSIQSALESLPNFAIPKVEVTGTLTRPTKTTGKGSKKKTVTLFDEPFTVDYEVEFTDPRNSGLLPILKVQTDARCLHGVQPKFVNDAADFSCTVERKATVSGVAFRENKECSGRGLCNRKTAECNCFDGYTGLSCDTIAQTY